VTYFKADARNFFLNMSRIFGKGICECTGRNLKSSVTFPLSVLLKMAPKDYTKHYISTGVHLFIYTTKL